MDLMPAKAASIPPDVLPPPDDIAAGRNAIHKTLPDHGLGLSHLTTHLSTDISPGLPASSTSSRYFGFVTGGVLPAAAAAESFVSQYDQNVAVHLPDASVATDVEHHALAMLCQLLDLDPAVWQHRIFSTGATASNVLGLACGREHVLVARDPGAGVAKLGLAGAMRKAGVDDVQVLCTVPHSSLRKACAVVGLGHDAIVEVGIGDGGAKFDFAALEEGLRRERTASIISVSCSEINTGAFATGGLEDMLQLRRLADRYGAWIHVDAAIGLLARVLPADDDEFGSIRKGVEGLELADSIGGDAHKLFNVPYDCGIFLSKHLAIGTSVFQNPGAPYLSTAANSIPSPLNIGIENSRRFRALPVYANLVAYGRSGYREMLARQIRFARRIAAYLREHAAYALLPEVIELQDIFVLVLFRAKDEDVNEGLVDRINVQRQIYCSGTKWEGRPAVRFAVSNWQVDMDRDWPVVQKVLDKAVEGS